jgi:UMF1 family MFS transporter
VSPPHIYTLNEIERSGYRVTAGCIGTIFALLLITPFVTNPSGVQSLLGPLGGWIQTTNALNSNAFLPTAGLYLLFSLPSFFFVPDRRIRAPLPVSLQATYRGVLSTIRHARSYAGMGTFLLATVLYTNASNTAVANRSLYGREVFGMEQG